MGESKIYELLYPTAEKKKKLTSYSRQARWRRFSGLGGVSGRRVSAGVPFDMGRSAVSVITVSVMGRHGRVDVTAFDYHRFFVRL